MLYHLLLPARPWPAPGHALALAAPDALSPGAVAALMGLLAALLLGGLILLLRARGEGRGAPTERRALLRALRRLEIGISVSGLLAIIWFAYSLAGQVRRVEDQQAMLRAIIAQRTDVTLSHLWLEEAIAEDSTVDVAGEIYGTLDRALRLCVAAGMPAAHAAHMRALCGHLRQLREISDERWTERQVSRAGDAADARYDALFREILIRSDSLEAGYVRDLRSTQQVANWRVSAMIALILFFMAALLYATARTRRAITQHARELRLLGSFVETSQDAIALKALDDTVLSWNPGAERIYGYSAEEVLGRQASMLAGDAGDPEERAVMERVRRGESGLSFETERVRKDGERIHVALSYSPVPDEEGRVAAVAVIARDITAQKEADLELQRRERKFRKLIEQAADLIWLLDAGGEARYLSPSVAPRLGYDADELIGQPFTSLLHPDDRPQMEEALAEAVRTPEEDPCRRPVLRIRHRDGSWRMFEAVVSDLLEDPDVQGVVVNAHDVTERTAAEARAQQQAGAMLASMDGMAVLDAEGRYQTLNPAHALIYGFDAPEQMVGRSWQTLYSAEELARFQAVVIPELQRDGYWRGEATGTRPDGSTFPQELALSLLPDGGLVCVVRDITERRRIVEQINASNERYRQVMLATKDTIWTWDLSDNAVTMSDALRDIVREDAPTEMSLEWWLQRIHPDDYDRVGASLDAVLTGEGSFWADEYRLRRGDGSYATVLDRGYVTRDDGGAPLRMIGAMADITDRKEAEAEQVRAREQAEEASRAKSDFLASMSHELRTPLNSVIGFTNVLRKNKDGRLAERDLDYLERILANGKHLLGLINDILDLSKIEAGKMELDVAAVDLNALVLDTLEHVKGAARGKAIELRAALPERVETLHTDAGKLKQVLINLLGNAIKFTEQGVITVSVSADPVSGRPLRLEVRDTGIGIPAERLTAIFQAFEQAEGGTARRFGGTGLGLTISSSLSELMGFRLEVESVLGVGSTFSVLLHPEGADAHERGTTGVLTTVPVQAAATDEELAVPLQGKLVLVIDDETDARMLLTHHIEELGCRTIAASSGEQGMRMAREFRPDLITLDLYLPGMTGWQILRALKDDAELCHIPVVIVSIAAHESQGSVLGALDLLEKPVERAELLRVLRRNLGGGPTRVLVVDDEEDARQLLVSYLKDDGAVVRAAHGGAEAMRELDAFLPELIVLDLLMPGMSGLDFLHALRASEAHRDIPVVVVTAKDLEAGEASELHRESMAVLHKSPSLEEELREVLHRVWTRASGAEPPPAP